MFWKLPNKLIHTLAFQLTLFYFILFSAILIVGASLFYYSVQRHLFLEVDTILKEIQERMLFYIEGHSNDPLQDEFKREAEARGTFRIFIRLFSPDGYVIVSSNLDAWPELPSLPLMGVRQLERERWETRFIDQGLIPIRILTVPVTNNQFFQTGMILQEQQKFLFSIFQEAVFIIRPSKVVAGGY